jgi:hypothetical protein
VSEPKLADVVLFWRKQGKTDFASNCTVQYSTTEISSIFAGAVEAAMPVLKAAGSSTKSSYSRDPFLEFSAVPFS